MRRFAFPLLSIAAGLLLAWILAELGPGLLFRLRPGLDPGGTRARLLAPASSQTGPSRPQTRLVAHPFTGYIANLEYPFPPPSQPVNDLGFHGLDPRTPKPPGTIRIALTGGSVAKGQTDVGGNHLVQELERIPRFHGRRVELVSLALGGFKQPQQLHALVHVLSLGAKLDVVINLDGFNEVALPPVYTDPLGSSPVYPRDWAQLTGSLSAGYSADHLARLGALRASLSWWRARLAVPASWGSRLAVLAFAACERLRFREEAALRAEFLTQVGPQAMPRGQRGPGPLPRNLAETVEQAVAMWTQSSRLMNDLCRSQGVSYLHFLQPNQYDPVSPPFSGPTRRLDSPMKEGAEAGYPRLREAGARLRSQGVPFHDLSQLFGARAEEMYGDDCCHYSWHGIQRVNEALAAQVQEIGRKQ